MRSAQLVSSLYMLLLFMVGFFVPGLTFSKLCYLLKLWLHFDCKVKVLFFSDLC